MNFSNKIIDTPSNDFFDKLIIEGKLKIETVFIQKSLNLMVLVLSNKMILKLNLSNYPQLNQASQMELDKWRLISGGIGIHWESLDEDLSLKGFLKPIILNMGYKYFIEHNNEEQLLF